MWREVLRKLWLKSWFDPYHICRKFIMRDIKKFSLYFTGTVLDVGCGDKPYESIFRERINRYIGLDLLPDIKIPDTIERKTKIDIYGSAFKLPLRNTSVDSIICIEVLEHLETPLEAVKEMARVLKKDGHLVLIAPKNFPAHEEPHDFYRFTKEGLAYLMRSNELEILELRQEGGVLACIGSGLSISLFTLLCLTKAGRINVAVSLFILPVCAVTQILFYLLDNVFKTGNDAINYCLVAVR